MNQQEKDLVKQFILRRIDFQNLENTFPKKINEEYIIEELLKLEVVNDGEALDYLITLAYRIGFTQKIGKILSTFLTKNWHKEHEEIARILQFRVKVPESINDLSVAMELKFSYLVERDDYESFVNKCMYAIADLNSRESMMKLEELAGSKNDVIRKSAQWQLDSLNGKNPEPLIW